MTSHDKLSSDDTRKKNHYFDASSPSAYLTEYGKCLVGMLKEVDSVLLDQAVVEIKRARQDGKRIFVAGNGGSAAIANHLCCDWGKGTAVPGQRALRLTSLNSNIPVLTAVANDLGYERIFSFQLDAEGEAGDVLILISSSGNSPNILDAAQTGKEKGMFVIGLSGFDGGDLRRLSDIVLHVPYSNYGLVEDCHQIVMHVIAQYTFLDSIK